MRNYMATALAVITIGCGAAMGQDDIKVCGPQSKCEPTLVMVGLNDQSQVLRLEKPFAGVRIIDPTVANVAAVTDQKFIVYGLRFGQTAVRFYDDQNTLLAGFTVAVQRAPGIVNIFNRPQFGSNNYRCTPTGCEFVDATKYEEPAQVNVNR